MVHFEGMNFPNYINWCEGIKHPHKDERCELPVDDKSYVANNSSEHYHHIPM